MLIALLLVMLSAPPTMKAIQIQSFGGPEVLQVAEVPRPVPREGELLVRVHAASVNPVDTIARMGEAEGITGARVPYVPGFDVSGVVEKVGAGVTAFRQGDAVFAMLDLRRGGGYAEYAIVKVSEAARKPEGLSHRDAAAIPLTALTAWQALFDTANLQRGQTVLIHAGAGGVGTMAVQLAKWKGAKVTATASAANHDYLKKLGADVVIDYRTQKFEDVAKDVDVVLDPSARSAIALSAHHRWLSPGYVSRMHVPAAFVRGILTASTVDDRSDSHREIASGRRCCGLRRCRRATERT